MRFFRVIRYGLLLPVLLLTLLTTPKPLDTDTAAFVDQDVFVMGQALAMGQGVTTDGAFFYTAGAATGLRVTYLGKIDIASMTMTAKRLNPLPSVCKARGNDHIGGIGELDRIQGGEFYHGSLYLSQDSRGAGTLKRILRLEPETGELTTAAERDVNSERMEAEDLTFLDRNGVPSLYVLDYNKAVGVFLREYALAAMKPDAR